MVSVKEYDNNQSSPSQPKGRYQKGTILQVQFSDLKALPGLHIDHKSKIIVEYKASLNDDAVIGAAGNPNEAQLIYSNNPNSAGQGEKGKTPWDKNIIFTYELNVNKVDNNGNSLVGAGFKLFKVDSKGKETLIGTEIGGQINPTSEFSWKCLDDGTYILRESTVPAGYDQMDDIIFEINADHSNDPDELKLKDLSVDVLSHQTASFTVDKKQGILSTDVINKKGVELPSTGGIGTTWFYIIGGIIVVGAGAMLVSRRRISNSDK